ncbi:MAG: hypothetical protein ACJ748_04905 [Flavisolibacter sp.]
MKSRQSFFFATLSDITPVLEKMDKAYPANFYKTGIFDKREVKQFKLASKLPELGYTQYGDWNYTNKFLVIPQEKSLIIREVPQKSGGIKYAIDQALNPISVIISPGAASDEGKSVGGGQDWNDH